MMKKRNMSLIEILMLGFVLFIMAGMFMPHSCGGREKPRRINCALNLKQIGLAAIIYAGDDAVQTGNDFGNFPSGDNFGLFSDLNYLVDGKVYVCPSAANPNTFASASNYTYVGDGLIDTDPNATTKVVAYCDNHHDWVNVLYVDGHVKGHRGTGPEFVRDYYESLKAKEAEGAE